MVLEKIKSIIAEQFDVDEESLAAETTFEELGADSLDIVELAMGIEEEFDLEIPEEKIDNIVTIEDLVRYIEKKL